MKYSVKIYDEYDRLIYDYEEEIDSPEDYFKTEYEAKEHGEYIISCMCLGYEINNDFQDEDDSDYHIEIVEIMI